MKNNSLPLVSVVLPVYNGERYLKEAIDSVLSQTFSDFELIIIDDGSSDGSASIIESYTDKRIVFIKQENRGQPSALNIGIEKSSGELIARMDQDDVCYPGRIENQVNYLDENRETIAVGSMADMIDMEGEDIMAISRPLSYEGILSALPNTPFIHPSVVFRKWAFIEAGRYPENFRYSYEDVVLFNKMAHIGRLNNIDMPLIKYRITPQSYHLKNIRHQKMMRPIIEKAISGSEITEKEFEGLESSLYEKNNREGKKGYYAFLAKRCLWSNPNPAKARLYLKNINRIYLSPSLSFLYILSFAPAPMINVAFNAAKIVIK